MNTLLVNDNKKNFIYRIFVSIFLIYAILSSNSLTYGNKIITPILWFSMLFSVVILVYRFLHIKSYLKIPETVLAITVLFSIGLSTLLNRNYAFKSNVIFCIYWVIYLLILFTCENKKSVSDVKENFRYVAGLFVAYTTVATIASFILLFMGVGKTLIAEDTNYGYNLGFVWGRLWGVFINPNNGAISCALSIIILVSAFIIYKKLWKRIVFGLLIFIHIMYIVFSDSRSGAVVFAVGVVTFSLCTVNVMKTKKFFLKLLAFIMAIAMAVTIFVCTRELKNITNSTINCISEIINKSGEDNNKEKDNINEKDNIKDNVIDRGYDISDDVSNRRFDVWKSGIEVYKNSAHNIVFGLSFCGFTEYARENLPETYIVNNDFGDMNTLDNEFLNILVSNGIIGLLSVAALVIYILVMIFKYFRFINSDNKYDVSLMMGIVVSLAAAAMFSSVMFFHFSPNTVIFWFTLGYLLTLLKNARECCNEK